MDTKKKEQGEHLYVQAIRDLDRALSETHKRGSLPPTLLSDSAKMNARQRTQSMLDLSATHPSASPRPVRSGTISVLATPLRTQQTDPWLGQKLPSRPPSPEKLIPADGETVGSDEGRVELCIPTGPCSHWGEMDPRLECIYQAQLPCSTGMLLPSFFSDDEDNDIWDVYNRQEKGLQPFLDEYTRAGWDESEKGCCLERHMRLRTPSATLPLGIGVSTTLVHMYHRIYRPSSTEMVYRTRAMPLDVPFSGSFTLDTKWHFQDVGNGMCVMKVYVEVVFLLPCWAKGMILARSTPPAIRNTIAVAKLLVDMAPQLLPGRGPDVILEESASEDDLGHPKRIKRSLAQLVENMPHTKHEALFANNPDVEPVAGAESEVQVLPGHFWAVMAAIDCLLLLHVLLFALRSRNIYTTTQGLLVEAKGLAAALAAAPKGQAAMQSHLQGLTLPQIAGGMIESQWDGGMQGTWWIGPLEGGSYTWVVGCGVLVVSMMGCVVVAVAGRRNVRY